MISVESFSEKFDKSKEFLKLAGILIEEQDTIRLSQHFLDYFFASWKMQYNINSAIFSALLAMTDREMDEEKLVSYFAIVKTMLVHNLRNHPEDLNAVAMLKMLESSHDKRT
jgi:hypothetical protein